jgi:hypothetical protein
VIWLAWRQFRFQAIAASCALGALAVLLFVTGLDLRHLYDTSGIAACKARGCPTSQLSFLSHTIVSRDKPMQELLGPLVLGVPALLGVFWGAPLIARELETGTYRLVWTQSITRWRWLAGKIAVVGLASVLIALIVSLMTSWWFAPVDKVNLNRFDPGVFGERGIVCLGYAAFAFASGVAAGAAFRRTLPAMATTLATFVLARLAVTYWLRPNLATPSHRVEQLNFGANADFEVGPHATVFASKPSIPNAWVDSAHIADRAGHTPNYGALHTFLQQHCAAIALPGRLPGPGAFRACAAQLSARFHLAVSYQPAGRYWAFQAYETAIFAGLALLLIGACFWWLRPGSGERPTKQRKTTRRQFDEFNGSAVADLSRRRSRTTASTR